VHSDTLTFSMLNMNTQISFINHACAVLSSGSVKLLCDPWLTGSCFNDGWDLIVDNNVGISELDFTHIWISHEHPDHFSPKDLQALDKSRRELTTIFYQDTTDKKLKRFCEDLGYKFQELKDFEKYDITGDVSITCAKSRGSDSWLLFEGTQGKILNINDCFVNSASELSEIKSFVGDINVLMSQYSFANWVGNENDIASQKKIAHMYLEIFAKQVKTLKPEVVIPFANFTWYSNDENVYLNRFSSKVHDAVKSINGNEVRPIVLAPGDRYVLGCDYDNSSALKFWAAAYASLETKTRRKSKKIALEELFRVFDVYQARLKDKNDWWAVLMTKNLGFLPSCDIFLTDHDLSVRFDIIEGMDLSNVERADCSISMSSDSLHFLLRHEWGRGTLQINGRFQANYDRLVDFIRQTQIAFANNIGLTYPATITPVNVINPNTFILRVADGNVEGHL
jgi:UDP-MurNAc hydroxylase